MHVLLDGKPVVAARPTVAAAIAACAEAAESRGRIIVEAKADGRVLEKWELEHPSDTPNEVSTVELTSADPRVLVRITLHDAADALRNMIEEQQATAAHINAGRMEEAVPALRSVLSTWQIVRDVVDQAARVLSIDLDAHRPGLSPQDQPGARAASLVARLGQVGEAIRNDDASALSDAVAYDLDDEAKGWVRLLVVLADEAAPRDGGAKA